MEKAWCLQEPGGILLVWNAQFTRRDCIRDAENWSGETWKQLRKRGYRCVKVTVALATERRAVGLAEMKPLETEAMSETTEQNETTRQQVPTSSLLSCACSEEHGLGQRFPILLAASEEFIHWFAECDYCGKRTGLKESKEEARLQWNEIAKAR